MGSEHEVAELCVGEEDDQEHDQEASNVESTSAESSLQLSHSFVETNVLEQFHPCEEHNDGESVVELGLQVSEPVEVPVSVAVSNEFLQFALHCSLSVD